MGIKIDPKRPDTFVVCHAKRHPVTKKPRRLIRKGIKTRAEAKRVEQELIVILNDKFKRDVVPNWAQFIEQYLANIKVSQLTNGT